MHSRTFFCTIFLCLISFCSFAQTKADSISLTFPKILIVNKEQQTLLAYDANRQAYEVPAFGAIRGPVDFDTYVENAAKEIGITYSSYRLGGIFTYVFPDQYRTYIRPYFVVQCTGYVNGGLADSSYKWVACKDAPKLIPYPASAKIVEKVLGLPGKVWMATFEEYGYTNPVDRGKIVFRVVREFSVVN